jgi:hypothetical protein
MAGMVPARSTCASTPSPRSEQIDRDGDRDRDRDHDRIGTERTWPAQ